MHSGHIHLGKHRRGISAHDVSLKVGKIDEIVLTSGNIDISTGCIDEITAEGIAGAIHNKFGHGTEVEHIAGHNIAVAINRERGTS